MRRPRSDAVVSMLFFGGQKQLIDHAPASRAGKWPAALVQALRDGAAPPTPAGNLLLGGPVHETFILSLTDESALVQTADFLSPVVNDPAVFGAIAAAHVLGPIYAMGGAPQFAYQLIGCPDGGG